MSVVVTINIFLQENTDAEDDADLIALKQNIKAALCRQRDDAFAEMAYAAKSGDVEKVRSSLRRGVDIDDVDYDGRTALAMVSAEDHLKLFRTN